MTRGVGYMISNPTAWLSFIPAFAGSTNMNF
jgi:hypothetical protein